MSQAKAIAACPVCGCFGPPELFLGEAARRGAIRAALALPSPLAEQVQAYVGLWRPTGRGRGHSWDRVESILTSLLALMQQVTLSADGRPVPVTTADWQAALNDLLTHRRQTLDLPLTSHGYLTRIVVGCARARAGQTERDQIARERTGAAPAARDVHVPAPRRDMQPVHELTGRLRSLANLIAAEPDPARRAALQQQIDDGRAKLDHLTGAPRD